MAKNAVKQDGRAMRALAQTGNPIVPAGVYIADPEAHQWADGRLYVYGSRDESTDYYCSHRYHVLSSCDLVNWDIDEDSFVSKGPNSQVTYRDSILYAPDCMYRDGTYYLYYCLTGGGEDEGVATSQSPYGPFLNGRKIAGISQIDPAVFIDDDGQAYLYWGQFNAKGAKLKPNMVEIEPDSVRENLLTEKEHFFHEGSSVRKRNGIYYFVYAHIGRRGRPTCLGYATSRSPLGPFTYQGVIIDNHGCDPASWNNHGSIAEFDGQWYVFYHRSTHNCVQMRKACVEPIEFNADGTIPEVKMTSQGAGGPIDARSRIEAARACQLTGHVRVEAKGPNREALCQIENGDTAAYRYIDFGKGIGGVTARVENVGAGGRIELRLDSPDGRLIGACEVPAGQRPMGWTTHQCEVTAAEGVHALYLTFVGTSGHLFDVDWLTFHR